MAEPVRKPPSDAPAEDERRIRTPKNLLGTAFRRVDGRAKVTGVTRFADDLSLPRMCYLRLVRSTVPHARILSIDFSEAEKVPGFLGAMTGGELPTPFGILRAEGLRHNDVENIQWLALLIHPLENLGYLADSDVAQFDERDTVVFEYVSDTPKPLTDRIIVIAVSEIVDLFLDRSIIVFEICQSDDVALVVFLLTRDVL